MLQDDIILSAINSTINNIDNWHEVLRQICLISGASKGIITLRRRQNAEMVIPDNVWHDLTSPLLYGFSSQEIGSYINDYVQYDPWTEYEKLFHPSLPYALSRFVKLTGLQQSPFWDWLSPQNISDCVVLEIGTSSPNWVAMNLFFDARDKATKKSTLELACRFQNQMRNAWQQGQQIRALNQGNSRLQFFLEQQAGAALVLESDARVVLMNDNAKRFFSEDSSIFVIKNDRLFVRNLSLRTELMAAIADLPDAVDTFPKWETEWQDIRIQLALMEKASDVSGADLSARLLSFQKRKQKRLLTNAPIWELNSLTKRERQLIEVLANGGGVVDFIKKYRLTKNTGHFHWGNAKRKLKVKKIAEIYAAHQIFLQNL